MLLFYGYYSMATILRVHPKCGFLTSLVWVLVCVSDILSVGFLLFGLGLWAWARVVVGFCPFVPRFRFLVLCRHSWAALFGRALFGRHSLGGTLWAALLGGTCGHESKPIVFVWFPCSCFLFFMCYFCLQQKRNYNVENIFHKQW